MADSTTHPSHHSFFLLPQYFLFNPHLFSILIYVLNSVSYLWPFMQRYLACLFLYRRGRRSYREVRCYGCAIIDPIIQLHYCTSHYSLEFLCWPQTNSYQFTLSPYSLVPPNGRLTSDSAVSETFWSSLALAYLSASRFLSREESTMIKLLWLIIVYIPTMTSSRSHHYHLHDCISSCRSSSTSSSLLWSRRPDS